MNSHRFLVVVVAVVIACLPTFATAAQPPYVVSPSGNAPQNMIQDVALSSGGALAIQIVDEQGKPHAGTPIRLRKAGATVHESTTSNDGQVVVAKLKPGVYEITSGTRGGIYRIWAPQTAPPRATSGILLIDERGVVRGARGGWQKAAIVGGVIITSGVVGGVIGYNIKDDAS